MNRIIKSLTLPVATLSLAFGAHAMTDQLSSNVYKSFRKAVADKKVTACLMNENYNVELIVANEAASEIGRHLCLGKARAAVFFSGYQIEPRKVLSDTQNSGLQQQLSHGRLSPTDGSGSMTCNGVTFGLGVMSDGRINTTTQAYGSDDKILGAIISDIPGCEAVKKS